MTGVVPTTHRTGSKPDQHGQPALPSGSLEVGGAHAATTISALNRPPGEWHLAIWPPQHPQVSGQEKQLEDLVRLGDHHPQRSAIPGRREYKALGLDRRQALELTRRNLRAEVED